MDKSEIMILLEKIFLLVVRFETNQRLTNYLEMYWGSSEKSAHRIFNTKPNIIQKTVWQKYAKIWEKYGKV